VNVVICISAVEWQGIEVSLLLGGAHGHPDPWMMSYNNFVSELHSKVWACFILFLSGGIHGTLWVGIG
jgi:hypothetical protein